MSATNWSSARASRPIDYKIESGCVRTYKTLDSGLRQMIAFHLPGDYFGLEGRELHVVSAEATTDSKICGSSARR